MTINLEVPLSSHGSGGIFALAFYATHYPVVLTHMIVGIGILAVSVTYLLFSLRSHYSSLIITGVIGLAAIIGAIFNGIEFLLSGQFFGYSIGMAMSAMFAILAYSVSLYFTGAIRVEIAGPRI